MTHLRLDRIDVNQLMCIKSAADRYCGELGALAADAGMDSDIATYLFISAKHLRDASEFLRRAILEESVKEAD